MFYFSSCNKHLIDNLGLRIPVESFSYDPEHNFEIYSLNPFEWDENTIAMIPEIVKYFGMIKNKDFIDACLLLYEKYSIEQEIKCITEAKNNSGLNILRLRILQAQLKRLNSAIDEQKK